MCKARSCNSACKSWLWTKNQSFLHNALGHFLGYSMVLLFSTTFQAKVSSSRNYCPGNEVLLHFPSLFVEWAFRNRSGYRLGCYLQIPRNKKRDIKMEWFLSLFVALVSCLANLIFLDLLSSANNNVLPSSNWTKNDNQVWQAKQKIQIFFVPKILWNRGQMQSIFWIVEAWS